MTSAVNSSKLFRQMCIIRAAEERMLALFTEGKISGTTHTCVGQEANAVAVMGQLDPAIDHVVSNHRCHGHYLAFGGPLEGLLGEVMGRSNGVCGGRGGSQHLKYGHFSSNGVLGGGIPIACGIAKAEKLKGSQAVVVVCIGDGALGEGTLYESLNMAALWELPVLFLVENNYYAQTTPLHLGVAGSIVDRAKPFGIATTEIETTDVEVLSAWASPLIERVRNEQKPQWAVIHTCRLSAHSKGDDTRAPAEIERLREKDPLTIQGARLSSEERDVLRQEAMQIVDQAVELCAAAALAEQL
jgi:TPP-dependent pyruvate/acetoin dehydrogenase alpha subunit